MTLVYLLRAHAEWVAMLRETLYGNGAVPRFMAADDRACPLGQWLRDHAAHCADMPEFRAAEDVHRRFHQRAAYALKLANAGRRIEALAETNEGGELRRLSALLVMTLRHFSRVVSSRHSQERRPPEFKEE